MSDTHSVKSALYHEFVLCIKYRCERCDYTSYPEFYDLLKSEGWIQQTELESVSDDIVHSGDEYSTQGKIFSNSRSETIAVLIHESGAEIWIIPVATFVAGAIASGVIGNAAYDLIQKIYSLLVKARDSDDNSDHYFSRHDDRRYTIKIILRTPDYESVDLSQLTVNRQLELIRKTISDRLAQLNIEWEGMIETKSLEKRIEVLENQLNITNLSHIQLMNEFQKERTEWRSRTSELFAHLARLEETNKRKFTRKIFGR